MQMPRKQRLPESAAAMTTMNIPVEFILEAPQALAVAITGGLNNWDAAQSPRQTSDYSRCRVTIVLRAGRYEKVAAAASQTVDDLARQGLLNIVARACDGMQTKERFKRNMNTLTSESQERSVWWGEATDAPAREDPRPTQSCKRYHYHKKGKHHGSHLD